MSIESHAGFSNLEVRLAVDMWKLQRAFDRTIADLPPERASQRSAQLRYSRDRLDALLSEAGLRIVTFEGEPFSAHLPVTPINGEQAAGDSAIIETTVEPTLIARNQVVHIGKVLLAEIGDVSRD
jgi:hypothetical protein